MSYLISSDLVSTRALYSTEPYLAHHGIKGQKWGVRRWQNEDGSLKSAGKGRYDGTPLVTRAKGAASKAAGSKVGKAAIKAANKEADRGVNSMISRNKKTGKVNVGRSILKTAFSLKLKTAGRALLTGAATLAATAGTLAATGNPILAKAAGTATLAAFGSYTVITSGREQVDRVMAVGRYAGKKISEIRESKSGK